MAVDSSKSSATTTVGAGTPPNGSVAHGAVAALAKRRRPSSLMKSASELPSVEHSLEEFIAKANQTLVDASTWAELDQKAREEEARRREQDAQRWKQAELQMRESEAREASLRRQLDGLQGKLAEAEARAAVAMSAASSGGLAVANEVAVADLKTQLEQSQQRLRTAEEQVHRVASDRASARSEAAAPRLAAASGAEPADGNAAERIRIAELKAVKAIAAARAAAAGLTVSASDLAALESGLAAAAPPPPQKSPWLAIMLAFVGGVALMFVVWKLALAGSGPAPAAPVAQPAPAVEIAQPPPAAQAAPAPQPAAAAQPAPVAQPAPAAQPPGPAATQPTVTPIDETAKPGPTVTPIEDPAAQPESPKAARPAARPPRPEAPKPTKPADKPPGGIVDPF
jgi:hypothetical protein